MQADSKVLFFKQGEKMQAIMHKMKVNLERDCQDMKKIKRSATFMDRK